MHDREGSHGAGAGADHGSAARRDPGRRTRTEHMQRRMRGVDVQFGAEPEPGPEAEPHASAGGGGNCDPGTMGSLYYGINPPRHAEKAYQPGDPAPPLHPRPTTVGKSGTIVALVTTIYNKPPFGKLAHFSICDRGGRVLHHGSGATPSRIEFQGLRPGSEVLVRPETLGTMVKLLTPEQIAGGADD